MVDLMTEIRKASNPERAASSQRFFKTGKGQYGEGDIFVGITVPESRKIAKKYSDISIADLQKHISSKIHEERLIALLILVEKYNENKNAVFEFYLKNKKWVNNWDLVDLSAHKIIGEYLIDKNIELLKDLAKSKSLWDRRIAIISTFAFIKRNRFSEAFKIAEILMYDKHDLIHKAAGWVLREIGKKDINSEKTFLKDRYRNMPRTMLRYAIERFPEIERQKYLRGEYD